MRKRLHGGQVAIVIIGKHFPKKSRAVQAHIWLSMLRELSQPGLAGSRKLGVRVRRPRWKKSFSTTATKSIGLLGAESTNSLAAASSIISDCASNVISRARIRLSGFVRSRRPLPDRGRPFFFQRQMVVRCGISCCKCNTNPIINAIERIAPPTRANAVACCA